MVRLGDGTVSCVKESPVVVKIFRISASISTSLLCNRSFSSRRMYCASSTCSFPLKSVRRLQSSVVYDAREEREKRDTTALAVRILRRKTNNMFSLMHSSIDSINSNTNMAMTTTIAPKCDRLKQKQHKYGLAARGW